MKLTKRKVCTLAVAALAAVAAAWYAIGYPDEDGAGRVAVTCRAADGSWQAEACVVVDRSRLSVAALSGM
jgi:hypothetical protein